MRKTEPRVLIVTGGLLTPSDRALGTALRKQVVQWRASEGAWLDLAIKLTAAEPLLLTRLARARTRDPDVREYFSAPPDEVPELTEVCLATLLEAESIVWECATVGELFDDPAGIERKLARANVVFASSTLLRDLGELSVVVARLRRPHLRLVVGGALVGLFGDAWEGEPGVDVVAVGYGEWLVPSLADWLRSGAAAPTPPPLGRLRRGRHSLFLHSGVPTSRDLDWLPLPDWRLAERAHGRRFRTVHYESVRGCPYRCAFCNYPYLFDDSRFRWKSAERIVADWTRYASEGVELVSCLDSLFTMPKRRLEALCYGLIAAAGPVRWAAYARTSDLCDAATVALMRRAGCVEVQIGLESGDDGQLSAMDKYCTSDQNARALDLCRTEGLTTVVSLIVGYPGETAATLDTTARFLEAHPPDFFFLATFSTRAPAVPVLSSESRARFGLRTVENRRAVAPYWTHHTMSCAEVPAKVRALHRHLVRGRVSLDAAAFYDGLRSYRHHQRAGLLAFQAQAMEPGPLVARVFDLAHDAVTRRLRAEVARAFA